MIYLKTENTLQTLPSIKNQIVFLRPLRCLTCEFPETSYDNKFYSVLINTKYTEKADTESPGRPPLIVQS